MMQALRRLEFFPMEYSKFICYFNKYLSSIYSIPGAIPETGFIPFNDYLLSLYYVLGTVFQCYSLQARRSQSSEGPVHLQCPYSPTWRHQAEADRFLAGLVGGRYKPGAQVALSFAINVLRIEKKNALQIQGAHIRWLANQTPAKSNRNTNGEILSQDY